MLTATAPQNSQSHLYPIEGLPVLPFVLTRVLALNPKHEDYYSDLTKIVQIDPTFTTKLLCLVNSASAQRHGPVQDVPTAIARMGSKATAELLVQMSVIRVFVPRTDEHRSLWLHALHVAIVSREIAKATGLEGSSSDEVYLAGLLHDIGRFVMFDMQKENVQLISDKSWEDPIGLVHAERTICGTDHAQIGADAAKQWGLPATLTTLIELHHETDFHSLPHKLSGLFAVIRQADWAMIRLIRRGDMSPKAMLRSAEASIYPGWPCLSPNKLVPIMEQAVLETDAAAQTLGLFPH